MILRRYLRELDIGDVCEEQSHSDGGHDGEGEEDGVFAPDSFRRFTEAKLHPLGETEVSSLGAISRKQRIEVIVSRTEECRSCNRSGGGSRY